MSDGSLLGLGGSAAPIGDRSPNAPTIRTVGVRTRIGAVLHYGRSLRRPGPDKGERISRLPPKALSVRNMSRMPRWRIPGSTLARLLLQKPHQSHAWCSLTQSHVH
ncbi:unnamed protein product, partial [Iphiclides podalirius]